MVKLQQKLQNRALRKTNFKKIHHPIKHIHKKHKILKFTDISKYKTVFSCIRSNKIMHVLPLFLPSTPETNTNKTPDLQAITC